MVKKSERKMRNREVNNNEGNVVAEYKVEDLTWNQAANLINLSNTAAKQG
jgi:hypothetical protein